jgi:putative intracellular protease/amidase
VTDETKRVLIVVSSHEDWPEADRKTGYWIGEVAHFVEVIQEAGIEFDVVSPQGGAAPMDPKSMKGMQSFDGGYKAYKRNAALQEKLQSTLRPEEVDPDDYAAIYFAGGHGTMWDFPGNEALARLAAQFYDSGRVVGAVCHGVAGLLDARLADGRYLLEGHEVTGFANVEERLMGYRSKVPYLTETRMRERGARYSRSLPFTAHAVVDGRLVTGQNPSSTKKVAQEVVALLR